MKTLLLVLAGMLLLSVSGQAQFGNGNARQIQGRPVCGNAPSNTNALVWDGTAGCWKPGTGPSGLYPGVTSNGLGLDIAGSATMGTTVINPTTGIKGPIIACVGAPGNTTGPYQSLCDVPSTGVLYACKNAAGCTVAADWSAQGSALTAAPPYLQSGGNSYITNDAMYQATLPSFGAWTVPANAGSGTASTQTNGNALFTYSGGTTGWLAAPSQITSIEAVVVFQPTASGTGGLWFWDSTNSLIDALRIKNTLASATGTLQKAAYSYNGGSAPSISSGSDLTLVDTLRVLHLKVAKASTTITYSISSDGGVTFTALGTTTSVGTISKIGIFSDPGVLNVLSMVVN